MSKVVDFLNELDVYYLATVEEGEARIRPICGVSEFDGKIYLATNNQKDMFKQIINNPSIAISGFNGKKWIRITGNAVVDKNADVKKEILESSPFLKNIYSIEDGIFEVYYIDNMKATIYTLTGESEILED